MPPNDFIGAIKFRKDKSSFQQDCYEYLSLVGFKDSLCIFRLKTSKVPTSERK